MRAPQRAAIAAAVLLAACSRGEPTTAPTTTPTQTSTPSASGEKWSASLSIPRALRPGAPAAARLRIEAKGGFHVNKDYPLAFTPAPDRTTDLAAARIPLAPGLERIACAPGSEDACAAVATVPFTPQAAGEVRVAGTLAFSVCSAEICLIEKVALAATGEAGRP